MAKKEKEKTGPKPKFNCPEKLTKAADAYFAEQEKKNKPFTITGLALALDTTRKTLCKYEEDPKIGNAVKRAKTRVENFAEERLYSSSPTGAIFALKNFGWSDRQDGDSPDQGLAATLAALISKLPG